MCLPVTPGIISIAGLTQIQHAARDFFNPLNPNTRTIAQCSGLIEPGLSLNSPGIGTLENQGDL